MNMIYLKPKQIKMKAQQRSKCSLPAAGNASKGAAREH